MRLQCAHDSYLIYLDCDQATHLYNVYQVLNVMDVQCFAGHVPVYISDHPLLLYTSQYTQYTHRSAEHNNVRYIVNYTLYSNHYFTHTSTSVLCWTSRFEISGLENNYILFHFTAMQCVILDYQQGPCAWVCHRMYSPLSYVLNCMLAELITLEERI